MIILSSNPFKVSGIHLLLQMCFILNILTRFSFISSLSSIRFSVQCHAFYCSGLFSPPGLETCSAVLFNVVHFLVLPPFAQSCQLKMNNLVQFFKNLCEVHWNNDNKKKLDLLLLVLLFFKSWRRSRNSSCRVKSKLLNC